ncbi:MAG TPA: dihydrolipoyl dehydrogenase [Methanotrichaceae archaeon]|nr:dihydrolipoyl dehydrogenase [Methanotrichaceae archaeon]
MEKYDVIVIGAGSGLKVAFNASKAGLKVALVDHGPLGGTCVNDGCLPSKMLIYPADIIRTLQNARAVGIKSAGIEIDFSMIMDRMRSAVMRSRSLREEAVKSRPNLTWHRDLAEFTDDRTLKVGNDVLTAPKIAIANGSRNRVPSLPGLKKAGYIDNTSLLDLKVPPESLVILGGGYIGCEYAHFFSAIGTKVALIGRNPRLLPGEDIEVSEIVKKVMSRSMRVLTNHEAKRVEVKGATKVIFAADRASNEEVQCGAEEILLAAGRGPNTDLLKPERTGVETDDRGWIKVDEYLETSRPGIWAFGDALGRHMFEHTANYEANVVWHNMMNDVKEKADFHAVPHAVFTYPQVGAVGMTENEAIEAGYEVLVGRAAYTEVTMGLAMAEEDGLVKAVVEEGTEKVLGCSIVGSDAAVLVQQAVMLMNGPGQNLDLLKRSQVIHPALSEVLARAFYRLKRPESSNP